MMSPVPSIPSYRVDRLAEVTEQIRRWAKRAKQLGLGQTVVDALRDVILKLQTVPLDWGDPTYKTKHRGGVVCHAIRSPFVVHYVVFETERIVCILEIAPLPGHPLGNGGESKD